MKSHLRVCVLGASLLAMGFSMPGCPGTTALEQRVDALEKKDSASQSRIQELEGRLQAQAEDVGQAKQLVAQVAQTVLAQKEAIGRIEASRQMGTRPAAAAPAKKNAANTPTKKTVTKKAVAKKTAKKRS